MLKTVEKGRADSGMTVEMMDFLAVEEEKPNRKVEREAMIRQGRGSCPRCGRTGILLEVQDRLQLFCVCHGDKPVLEIAGRLGASE